MTGIAKSWSDEGITGGWLGYVLGFKNTILLPYFSLLYFLGGNEYFLNIAVLNSLHSTLSALLVFFLKIRLSGRRYSKSIFLLALLQPLGLTSSILWRDSVGQFFIIAGFIIIGFLTNRGKVVFFTRMIFAFFAIASLRTIYLMNGLIILAGRYFLPNSAVFREKIKVGSSLKKIILGVLVFYLFINVWDTVLYYYDFGSQNFTFQLSPSAFLKNSAIALIGPFPIHQLADPNVPGRLYLFDSVLQAAFSNVILIYLIKFIFDVKGRICRGTFLVLIFVFSIMVLGIFGNGHTSYVTVASILLLSTLHRINLFWFLLLWAVYLCFIGILSEVWVFQ